MSAGFIFYYPPDSFESQHELCHPDQYFPGLGLQQPPFHLFSEVRRPVGQPKQDAGLVVLTQLVRLADVLDGYAGRDLMAAVVPSGLISHFLLLHPLGAYSFLEFRRA